MVVSSAEFLDVNLLLSSDVFGRGGAALEQDPQTFQYQVKLDINIMALGLHIKVLFSLI